MASVVCSRIVASVVYSRIAASVVCSKDSSVSWGQQIVDLMGHNRVVILAGAVVRGT